VLAPYGTEMARSTTGLAARLLASSRPGTSPLTWGGVAEDPLLPGGRNQTLRNRALIAYEPLCLA
jgi:hypothetical protein